MPGNQNFACPYNTNQFITNLLYYTREGPLILVKMSDARTALPRVDDDTTVQDCNHFFLEKKEREMPKFLDFDTLCCV